MVYNKEVEPKNLDSLPNEEIQRYKRYLTKIMKIIVEG